MQMPSFAPAAPSLIASKSDVSNSALRQQGCNALEWIECGGVATVCAGLSGPALVACVAAALPNCVKCVT
jgi:hypothetical protein